MKRQVLRYFADRTTSKLTPETKELVSSVAGGPPTKLVAAPAAPQAAKSKSFDQQQKYSTMIRILTVLAFFTAIVALSSGQCTFRCDRKS